MVKFSILILSIPNRLNMLKNLYDKLQKQIDNYGLSKQVEILTLIDNKVLSIGEKRNKILNSSKGNFIAFLDDDDDISDDYIIQIINSIGKNPSVDVICFNQDCTVNDKKFIVEFNVGNPHEAVSDKPKILRPPYHMCVWNRNLATSESFSDRSYGEDIEWLIRLYPKIKKSVKIDKILHYYKFSDFTSESLKFRRENI